MHVLRFPAGAVGLALAAALSLAAIRSPRPAAVGQADALADSLVGLWIDSAGGMATYQAFQSARFTVTTELYDTLSGRLRRARPRYVWINKGPYGEETRVERWEDYGFIAQGFDGRTAWATVNGAAIPDTAKDAREALYVARDLFYWMGLPFKLRDPGVHLRYLGLRERPGAPWPDETRWRTPARGGRYHAVGVSFAPGVGEHQDVFTYYFAPGGGFPLEVTYVEEGRTDLNRLVWGPTAQAGAIRYPYVGRRDWLTLSGKRTKALIISDVEINPALPQAIFQRP